MPTRLWTHLCDYATIDSSGKPSIIGEFEYINTKVFPISLPIIAVATKWAGNGTEKFTQTVRLLSPSSNIVAESTKQEITIPGSPDSESTFTSIAYFLLTKFELAGQYAVDILIDNLSVHVIQLHVRQI